MPRLAISQMPIKALEDLTGEELLPIISQTEEGQPPLNMAVRLSDIKVETPPPEVELLNLCKEFLDVDGAVILTPIINYTIPESDATIDGTNLTISGFELSENNFVISMPQRKESLILTIGNINNTSESTVTYNVNYGTNIEAVPFTQVLLENVDYIIINVPQGTDNSVIVSVSEAFVAENCNIVNKVVITEDTELQVEFNGNEARVSQIYNGNFFQEGDVVIDGGSEGNTGLRFRLNMAKIARERPLPGSSDLGISINLNYVLSLAGSEAPASVSGNLIYTPYSRVYSVANQTSLEAIVPSDVGSYSATVEGTLTLLDVEYDGIYLNFQLAYNSFTLPSFNKFQMSGNIIWYGNAAEPT